MMTFVELPCVEVSAGYVDLAQYSLLLSRFFATDSRPHIQDFKRC